MKRIVGFGACVYDTLIECEKFPVEDTKLKADNISVSGGGPVGNALVVASKLGVKTSVIGAFANDAAGNYLLDDFKKYGVDISGVKIIDGAKSFNSYILLSKSEGSRTCVFNRGTVLDDENNANLSVIDGADILHLDGNYLNGALKCAKYAKEKGVLVSLDAGGLYEGIEKLLPFVDILIPSAEFAMGLTGKDAPIDALIELNKRYSPKILAVTDGKNGGYYIEDNSAARYPAFTVKAVDSNGAGDTFHGAFLAAYLSGKSVRESLIFASATSAYKCGFVGARTYPLSTEKVLEFIKENS
ncbi:MAG: hypothetical protein IKB30_06285 [Clostridia bacterium]|nr:hypothetical protein [Clostridia bacterium]